MVSDLVRALPKKHKVSLKTAVPIPLGSPAAAAQMGLQCSEPEPASLTFKPDPQGDSWQARDAKGGHHRIIQVRPGETAWELLTIAMLAAQYVCGRASRLGLMGWRFGLAEYHVYREAKGLGKMTAADMVRIA